MRKFFTAILHILGYPVLIAVVVLLNFNIIATQFKNYNIFTLVGLIVTVLMTAIYYICYACITKKPRQNKKKKSTKKRKSIFNQTVRICMVVVITLTGLWVVCDIALPDFLADATSSTIYYEDLADGWDDRADVNEELLNTFIELSVKAGTLPYDSEAMSEEEAIEYYIDAGINKAVPELGDNEYYGDVAGLFAIQYQSINANGYTTFTHPWIDFATSNRLTIPCLIHLLLDEREITQGAITLDEYTNVVENEDGTTEVDTVFFAVCEKKEDGTSEIKLEGVNWTVLDMLGTDNVIDLGSLKNSLPPVVNDMLPLIKNAKIIEKLLDKLIPIVAEEELLGSGLNVLIDLDTFVITLRPTNAERGVLGYQEMAWLDSNGLIYALVTLFSLRRVFLIAAAYLVVINLLIGCARGMLKEEKARRKRAEAPLPVKEPVENNDVFGGIIK